MSGNSRYSSAGERASLVGQGLNQLDSSLQTLAREMQQCATQNSVDDAQYKCMGQALQSQLIPGIQAVTTALSDAHLNVGKASLECCAKPDSSGNSQASELAREVDTQLRDDINDALQNFNDLSATMQTCSQKHPQDSALDAGMRLACYHDKNIFQSLSIRLASDL